MRIFRRELIIHLLNGMLARRPVAVRQLIEASKYCPTILIPRTRLCHENIGCSNANLGLARYYPATVLAKPYIAEGKLLECCRQAIVCITRL